jgi:hypothetical protein
MLDRNMNLEVSCVVTLFATYRAQLALPFRSVLVLSAQVALEQIHLRGTNILIYI